jgi:hypothetical protein
MLYKVYWLYDRASIAVVGCGGTGGFVAEGLCRLLPPSYNIILIDHDQVEDHNLIRQNFYTSDLGKYKSKVIAERLAKNYGRKIGYSIYSATSNELHNFPLIIGCADNAIARRAINNGNHFWWLDSGNSDNSGQVLFGNCNSVPSLQGIYRGIFCGEQIHALPNPALQQPSLLLPAPAPQIACAEAVRDNYQSPVINQFMASIVLLFVQKLITNSLPWMAAYIDLDTGNLNLVPAEPKTVARMTGLRINQLIKKETSS